MSRRPAPRRRPVATRPEPRLSPRTALALCVAGGLLACTVVGWLPGWLAVWLLIASLWTFGLYWRDKRAAMRATQRRTPERTLQMLALAGGWPGALFAQSLLRHKSRKASFQQVFWVCVVANVASVAVLLRAAGQYT